MRHCTKCLHVNLVSVNSIKPLGQEMSTTAFLHNRTFGHVNAAILDKTRKGILQPTEILRFAETCFRSHAIQFYQVVPETLWSLNLPRPNLTSLFIVRNYSLGTLTSGRSPQADNLRNGGFPILVEVSPKLFFF